MYRSTISSPYVYGSRIFASPLAHRGYSHPFYHGIPVNRYPTIVRPRCCICCPPGAKCCVEGQCVNGACCPKTTCCPVTQTIPAQCCPVAKATCTCPPNAECCVDGVCTLAECPSNNNCCSSPDPCCCPPGSPCCVEGKCAQGTCGDLPCCKPVACEKTTECCPPVECCAPVETVAPVCPQSATCTITGPHRHLGAVAPQHPFYHPYGPRRVFGGNPWGYHSRSFVGAPRVYHSAPWQNSIVRTAPGIVLDSQVITTEAPVEVCTQAPVEEVITTEQ